MEEGLSKKREHDSDGNIQSSSDEYGIPLHNVKKEIIGWTFVSPDDYDLLNTLKWCKRSNGSVGSRDSNIGSLHKYIYTKLMGHVLPDDSFVGHINGNYLDNRRENLHVVSLSQMARQPKKRKTKLNDGINKNPYNCVSFIGKTWQGRIFINGVCNYVGSYDSPKKAAYAVDRFIFHHPQRASLGYELNFPDIDYTNEPAFVKTKKLPSSNYIGVSKTKSGTYQTTISMGKMQKCKNFIDELDAAKYYDEYVVTNQLAKPLNFPEMYPEHESQKIRIRKEYLPCGRLVKLITDNTRINNANIRVTIADYERIKFYAPSISKEGRPHIKVNGKTTLLYRYIMNVTNAKVFVEHFPDPDPFNCDRQNLLLSDAAKNSEFKQPRAGTITVGVQKNNGSYMGVIQKNGIKVYAKTYNNKEYAIRARDIFLIDHPEYRHKQNCDDWNDVLITEWKNKLKEYDPYCKL